MKAPRHFPLPRLLRGILGFVLFAAVWEGFARSGLFSQALTPPLETILATTWTLLAAGHILHSMASTLGRVLAGFAISLVIAVPIGLLMGRSRMCERLVAPPLSAFLPIPSLAWVPILILWFGIGNAATIIVIVYAATTQLIYNIWIGVRAVNPLWIRAATAMGAGRTSVFARVILPGALPHIFTGMRLAFGRAWIAVIGGELLSSPRWGLGTVIFDAGEFLNTATMLSALLFIGLIGVCFEQLVFNNLERVTVRRWGMSHDTMSSRR
ncbi:MAG: ABC transporter permease [Candidimonas sp.]|nr:MAG: ABC transporter permease [Candidimonas sp.]